MIIIPENQWEIRIDNLKNFIRFSEVKVFKVKAPRDILTCIVQDIPKISKHANDSDNQIWKSL